MKLTGISIGYQNNLIYKHSDIEALKDFKSYLDSSELERIDIINLWYETENGSILFLTITPHRQDNIWKVDDNKCSVYPLKHIEGYNLLDEIEQYLNTWNNSVTY